MSLLLVEIGVTFSRGNEGYDSLVKTYDNKNDPREDAEKHSRNKSSRYKGQMNLMSAGGKFNRQQRFVRTHGLRRHPVDRCGPTIIERLRKKQLMSIGYVLGSRK